MITNMKATEESVKGLLSILEKKKEENQDHESTTGRYLKI